MIASYKHSLRFSAKINKQPHIKIYTNFNAAVNYIISKTSIDINSFILIEYYILLPCNYYWVLEAALPICYTVN